MQHDPICVTNSAAWDLGVESLAVRVGVELGLRGVVVAIGREGRNFSRSTGLASQLYHTLAV